MENQNFAEIGDIAVSFVGNEIGCARFNEAGSIESRAFEMIGGNENLTRQISEWLFPHNLTFGFDTIFHTTPVGFVEHTRQLQLPDDILQLPDDQLNAWLITAAQTKVAGTDSKPLFERSWQDYSYHCYRGENGKIYATEIPRAELSVLSDALLNSSSIKTLIASLPDDAAPSLNIRVETRTRALYRHLFVTQEALAANNSAVVYLSETGWGYGFYRPGQGIIDEISEEFQLPDGAAQLDVSENFRGVIYDVLQIFLERFQEIFGDSDASVYWVATRSLADLTAAQLEEFARYRQFDKHRLPFALSEGCAAGLLASETEMGTSLVSPINIADDLQALYKKDVDLKQSERMAGAITRQRAAMMAIFAPFFVLFGLFIGLYADTFRETFSLSRRESAADTESARLAPILDARNSYVQNFRWYESYINQVVDLRLKQSIPLGFFDDLNPRFPLSSDPTFYVSDIKLGRDGTFEIKGLCREESTVTAFVRSLEFSDSTASNQKIFSNLTFDVKQGNQAGGNQTALPVAGAALPNSFAWVVKGNYSPLSGPPKTTAPTVVPASVNPNSSTPTQPAANKAPVTTMTPPAAK